MNKHLLTAAAAAALALASFGASAASELVGNGSFEADAVAQGTWGLFTAPVDWTVSYEAGAPTTGLELRNDIVGTAQDGHNFAELDADRNVTITQDLATVAGQTYTLSFWYSDRAGTQAFTNGLSFSVGDVLSGGVAGADNTGADNVWHHVSRTFVADGSTTALSFTGTGASDSLGMSLDNVSVLAVPEPATVGLLACGLALVGVARRRQR